MKPQLVFGRLNYILMLAGLAVIILGFVLMSGHEDIYSTTKITVAPIVLMVGFLIEIVAILYKPKVEQHVAHGQATATGDALNR